MLCALMAVFNFIKNAKRGLSAYILSAGFPGYGWNDLHVPIRRTDPLGQGWLRRVGRSPFVLIFFSG